MDADSFYYAAGWTWVWGTISIIAVFLAMLFWDLLMGWLGAVPDDDDFLDEGN